MRKLLKPCLAAGMAIPFVGAIAQPAHSTYYSYAVGAWTERNESHTSSVQSSLVGGRVSAPYEINIYLYIKTLVTYPGYSVYSSTAGTAPGWIYLWHDRVNNHKSRCHWWHSPDIGPIQISCDYNR